MRVEKANVVPIHKKGDKQTLKNYHLVSLLPICSKIFERLLYNEMFGFFLDQDLFQLINQVLNQETPALINFYQ